MQRHLLAQQLENVAKHLTTTLDCVPDASLLMDYKQVFGCSEFFENEILDQILRLRTWIDNTACDNSLLAEFLTQAVLSALVPASKLKRAGDLRYKTQRELLTQTYEFIPTVADQIKLMAEDIREFPEYMYKTPLLVAEDARVLAYLPALGIDAVITSPPYVNGTNYFRNTKIELWFLRCLHSQADLTAFRGKTVTAGINDVTAQRQCIPVCQPVEDVVKQLENKAYDRRIPRMVACYFSDISNVFGGIRSHLNPGARICIDIGDSIYAGVHVPADELLHSVLHTQGFKLIDDILLRQRRSRDGSPLKQSLLVFEYSCNQKSKATVFTVPWFDEWHSFKCILPHQNEPYASRNWGHPLHSLCSYSGKLKPSIAHHLVKIFVPDGGRVLDPFSGVGTIPFEAALTGKQAYAFDISPLALAVSKGKLQRTTWLECNDLLSNLLHYIDNNEPSKDEMLETQNLGFNGVIADYYEQCTLKEILLARRFFMIKGLNTPACNLVFACLLHILHGNRPYALSRRSHPLTPYKPSGPFEYRPLLASLTDKVHRSLETDVPEHFQEGHVYAQDATAWWPSDVYQLDAIITSPPFFDSTRFYLANWLRLWFSGWSSSDFSDRPNAFIDERQKQTFDVYIPLLRQARERLKPGGVLVMHLGRSRKCDMATELIKLGLRWFKTADILDENVEHCESHGVRDKGTVTSHQYLVLH